jgi:hypothetical protein
MRRRRIYALERLNAAWEASPEDSEIEEEADALARSIPRFSSLPRGKYHGKA